MAVDLGLGELQRASERGARWLVEHRDDDGFPASTEVCVNACYKTLWALGLHGYGAEAALTLAGIVEGWLDERGDVPQPRREGSLARHYLYPNAYLVIGAKMNGLERLAHALYAFIRTRRDPRLGGFYTQPPAADGPLSMDTASTAVAGLAALSLGDLDAADGAARFLRHALESQPEADVAFYTGVAPGGETVTDSPAERRAWRVGIGEPVQAWHFISLPAWFLAALHEETGDPAQLDLARRYFDLFVDCGDDAIACFSSGKGAVGAARLFRLTGEPRYRELALTVADDIVRRQDPPGCWRWDPPEPIPDVFDPADLDLTAEYVVWLHEIRAHLRD